MHLISLTPILFSLMMALTGSSTSLLIQSSANQATFYQNSQKSEVEKYAKSITVRIFPKNSNNLSGGSGVLVGKTQNQYTILTNYHVINQKNLTYQVATFDGRVYEAQILYVPESDTKGDVAFLTFTSNNPTYPIATLKSDIIIEKETSVISGGFPFENDLKQSQTFQITEGKITEVLDRPFIGGYQIGYTNSVRKGMSGGPVLNYNQELIGINGMGQYPLFGNPYTFEDGSTIPDSEWDGFSQLSWAVPISIIKGIREKNTFN